MLAKVPGVGVGNGTGCGFTGSYDEVAKRIVAFHEAGVEMILLEFQPFLTGNAALRIQGKASRLYPTLEPGPSFPGLKISKRIFPSNQSVTRNTEPPVKLNTYYSFILFRLRTLPSIFLGLIKWIYRIILPASKKINLPVLSGRPASVAFHYCQTVPGGFSVKPTTNLMVVTTGFL